MFRKQKLSFVAQMNCQLMAITSDNVLAFIDKNCIYIIFQHVNSIRILFRYAVVIYLYFPSKHPSIYRTNIDHIALNLQGSVLGNKRIYKKVDYKNSVAYSAAEMPRKFSNGFMRPKNDNKLI